MWHAQRLAWLIAIVVVAFTTPFQVRDANGLDPVNLPFEPAPPLEPVNTTGVRGDTLDFGYVDQDGFAVVGESWTFDHGGPDPLEGWTERDITAQDGTFFRLIDIASWEADVNDVPPPILRGAGSAWLGAFESEALDACWEAGLGYGNHWCQRLESPEFTYEGAGTVELEFVYFNDTELNFDYTRVLLRLLPSGEEISLNGDGFTDQFGLAPEHPVTPPDGVSFETVLTESDFAGETTFQIVFEMTSDGGWSDEDGSYTTAYGPFACDDVELRGAIGGGDRTYSFEPDLEGWTAVACPGVGLFVGVEHVSAYTLIDPCVCPVSGNVLEMHDEFHEHPDGQRTFAVSPIVDVENDVVPALPSSGALEIFVDWDQNVDLPQANGVFYRPGWDYFPFVCELTGNVSWSGRVGQNAQFYIDEPSGCWASRNIATHHGIPQDVEQIRFLYELYASCDAFGIPEEVCTGVTNFTPVLDNIRIRFTRVEAAPPIGFDPGTRYQDGFAQSFFSDPDVAGRADITRNVNFGNAAPFVLGDSLFVSGPLPASGENWEAKLWFRIRREGPRAADHSAYSSWRDLYGGTAIVGPNAQFASGYMDSFQVGTNVAKNRFVSYLREDDPRFDAGAGEFGDQNEIIRDDVLFPGTAIDYFVTSAFVLTPEVYFTLPDTAGGYFNEFEILPSYREIDGVLKAPALLYIDADNRTAQSFIEDALNVVVAGQSPGSPILDPPLWDRYDYLDASSNWAAPMARGQGPISNNGMTLPQLLGYRAIILNTGTFSTGVMWPEDYVLLSDWLSAYQLANPTDTRHGILVNGDNAATAMGQFGSGYLSDLGVRLVDYSYNEFANDSESWCVEIEPGPESVFSASNEVDAWGNSCPRVYSFDVIEPVGDAAGHRVYRNGANGEETPYAQVTVDRTIENHPSYADLDYRTIFSGVSWHHLALRDPIEECPSGFEEVAGAIATELSDGLAWIFDGSFSPLVEDPGPWDTSNVGPVTPRDTMPQTALLPNRPNPVTAETTMRFHLAEAGPVSIRIFDASGREVRTIANRSFETGPHEISWDGTDDTGRRLPSGIYWSQLVAGGFQGRSQMVLLP